MDYTDQFERNRVVKFVLWWPLSCSPTKHSEKSHWSLFHLCYFPPFFSDTSPKLQDCSMNLVLEWQHITSHGIQATERSLAPNGRTCDSLTWLLQRIYLFLTSHRTFTESSDYSSALNYTLRGPNVIYGTVGHAQMCPRDYGETIAPGLHLLIHSFPHCHPPLLLLSTALPVAPAL